MTRLQATLARCSSAVACLRQVNGRGRLLLSVASAAAMLLWLVALALIQERSLGPRMHDEWSILLQARMLASGRLWMPAHPLGEFLDSFHILVSPVYASIYFPGAALAYAPANWVSAPPWWTPTLLTAVGAGLVFWLVSECVDGVAGVLAVLLMMASSMLRKVGMMSLTQPVALFLIGSLFVGALCWRRTGRRRWALLDGAAAGWLAITRPVDALCFLAPVAASLAMDLARRPPAIRRWLLGAAIGAAIPFLGLQIALDWGTTGDPFVTPYQQYIDREHPGSSPGFRSFVDEARPDSILPQKQAYFRDFVRPKIEAHAPLASLRRVFTDLSLKALRSAFPWPWMAVLLAVGLLGRWRDGRWALLAPVPLFLMAYFCTPFGMAHYTVVLVPSLLLWSLSALPVLGERSRWLRASVEAGLLMVVVLALPPLRPPSRDLLMNTPTLDRIEALLGQTVQPPAVVLFKWAEGENPHEEPVYNVSTPWPDDAPVIRLHALGRRTAEVLDYFLARQPSRRLYVYDRADDSLRDMGTVAELTRARGATR